MLAGILAPAARLEQRLVDGIQSAATCRHRLPQAGGHAGPAPGSSKCLLGDPICRHRPPQVVTGCRASWPRPQCSSKGLLGGSNPPPQAATGCHRLPGILAPASRLEQRFVRGVPIRRHRLPQAARHSGPSLQAQAKVCWRGSNPPPQAVTGCHRLLGILAPASRLQASRSQNVHKSIKNNGFKTSSSFEGLHPASPGL
jgi:hypothetical protein